MRRAAWYAFAAYLFIALAVTWPLAGGLQRDVASDLGDPLLVTWAIAWDCEQILRLLRGDLSRLTQFFDANIFHPAPLTLAYSEHFVAQAVQILPVYVLSGNPILCYNLLVLATFVLCGLGAFLWVRELTRHTLAAFFAGLVFAYAPFRAAELSHLHVLSAQWMPFALYGLRRYFESGRARPLVGAALALVTQYLSCAYYLFFFSPVVVVYVLWEVGARGLWRRTRTWAEIGLAAIAVAVLTAPFLLPYVIVQQQLQSPRRLAEVVRYSADVYAYLTASRDLPVWGRIMAAYPAVEGSLFPGLITLIAAAIGIAFWRGADEHLRPYVASDGHARERLAPWMRVLLVAAVVGHVAAAVSTLFFRRIAFDAGPIGLRMTDANQLLLRAGLLWVLVVVLSPSIRHWARAFLRARGFYVLCLVVAAWLSLGPEPRSLGRPVQLVGLYHVLYDYVPGLDGLRVPARFGTIVGLMLAALAGYGAALAASRRGRLIVLAASVLVIIEGAAIPFPVNRATEPAGYNSPGARVVRPSRAPAVYRAIAETPADAVLAELPLGVPDFDLRAMYYSTIHWRALVNGYSGYFPPHYLQVTVALSDIPRHPQSALDALAVVRATHVLVHEDAYRGGEGDRITESLQALGATPVFRDGRDVLLQLPRGQRN